MFLHKLDHSPLPPQQQPTILIVDDDARACALLSTYLPTQGFTTRTVMDGLLVEPEVRRAGPDLVLLDVTLPGCDGLEVCRRLRRFSSVPIIMLSGRVDEIDRTLGLEVGADDYVCKPYSPRELVARIKAQLRRVDGRVSALPAPAGYRIDEAGRRIAWQEQWLALTPQEFRLLSRLLTRPGQLFTREELADAGEGRPAAVRAVDSHVKNLRRKLDAVSAGGGTIVSVYGAGYRFDPAPAHAVEPDHRMETA